MWRSHGDVEMGRKRNDKPSLLRKALHNQSKIVFSKFSVKLAEHEQYINMPSDLLTWATWDT